MNATRFARVWGLFSCATLGAALGFVAMGIGCAASIDAPDLSARPTPVAAAFDDLASSGQQQVTTAGMDAIALTESLVQLGRRWQGADADARVEVLAALQAVAQARRRHMEELALRDPDAFLRTALPADERAALPEEVRADVEDDAAVVGRVRVVCALRAERDDEGRFAEERSCSRDLVTMDGGVVALSFRSVPSWLETGVSASAVGVRIGDVLVLDEPEAMVRLVNAMHVAAAGGQPTIGEQRTLVLLVNYLDDASQPITPAQLQSAVFTQTDAFFRENSYGQTFLSGEVHGWFTLPINKGSVDVFTEAEIAEQAATAAGVDVTRFSRIVLYQTSGAGSASGGFSGLGTVGGNPSYAWLTGAPAVALIAHEMGHNLGLMHANRFECGAGVSISPTCAVVEYGDPYDTMGQSFTLNGFASPHFNAFHKEQLGWLGANASPPVTAVTSSGAYTISTMSTPNDGAPKSLRIVRSTNATTGEQTFLYVEHRARSGFDATLGSAFNANFQVVPLAFEDGVFLHFGQSVNGDTSRLIDPSPVDADTRTTSGDMIDAALHVGQTFTDPQSGIAFSVVGANASSATVQVTFPSTQQPCARAAPSITISPSTQSATAGNAVSYVATITNLDSATCAPRSFALGATAPAPIVLDAITASTTLSPSQSTTQLLRVTAPGGMAATTATINLTVTPTDNAAQAASGTASLVVQDPVSTCVRNFPSLSVAPQVQGGLAGASLPYVLTVVNRDSASCAASTFDVHALVPANFTRTIAATQLSLAPGVSASSTITATSPANAAAGNYPLSFEAARTVDAGTSSSSIGATYVVNAPPPPSCVRAVPAISLAPSSQFGPAGGALAYSVRIDNRDSAGCSNASFTLTAQLPSGFTSSYSAPSLALAPGASATTTWTVTSPTSAPGQIFAITTQVAHGADAALGAAAAASYGVTAVLGVSVTTDKSAYVGNETVRIVTTATSGGTGLAGASVSVRIVDPRGRATTFTTTTSAVGQGTVSLALPRRARTGTWSVTSTVGAGTGSAQGSTTFVVR